jgi:RimJ/RimL family protein N-acetyltransferase
MKPAISPTSFGNVQLRLLELDDLPHTLAWRNQDDVRKWFKFNGTVTAEQHLAWFEKYQAKADDFVFVALHLKSQERIGQVAIYDVDLMQKQAEVGRFIVAPEAAGKGFMTEALQALADCATQQLALSRLFLEVFASNARAINLYSKAGYQRCGARDELLVMDKLLAPAPVTGT